MTEVLPQNGADVYASPLNITIGRGRILWGEATEDARKRIHPAGWVLPGGRRTTSREQAEAAAKRIDEISRYGRYDF